MKKIIISLDHVVGAIMAAYEKEMEIKSCSLVSASSFRPLSEKSARAS